MLRCCLSLTLLALLLPSRPLLAQDTPRLELAGSYQFLQPLCPNVSCYNYPVGWQGSVAVGVTNWLSVVGEVGGNRKTVTTSIYGSIPTVTIPTGTPTSTSEAAAYAFLGGLRAARQLTPALRLFGEVMFGANHFTHATSSSLSFPEEAAQVGTVFSASSTGWGWQPGLGVDVAVAPRWAVRVGVDYRLRLQPETYPSGDVLFVSGIVFRPFGPSVNKRPHQSHS
jgi:hypothetical protein